MLRSDIRPAVELRNEYNITLRHRRKISCLPQSKHITLSASETEHLILREFESICQKRKSVFFVPYCQNKNPVDESRQDFFVFFSLPFSGLAGGNRGRAEARNDRRAAPSSGSRERQALPLRGRLYVGTGRLVGTWVRRSSSHVILRKQKTCHPEREQRITCHPERSEAKSKDLCLAVSTHVILSGAKRSRRISTPAQGMTLAGLGYNRCRALDPSSALPPQDDNARTRRRRRSGRGSPRASTPTGAPQRIAGGASPSPTGETGRKGRGDAVHYSAQRNRLPP